MAAVSAKASSTWASVKPPTRMRLSLTWRLVAPSVTVRVWSLREAGSSRLATA